MHLKGPLSEASDLLEYLVRSLDPLEGLGLLIVRLDVLLDGGSELSHARVRTSLEGMLCEQPKKAFDQI